MTNGSDRIRTDNFLHAKQTVYQLTYTPSNSTEFKEILFQKVVLFKSQLRFFYSERFSKGYPLIGEKR